MVLFTGKVISCFLCLQIFKADSFSFGSLRGFLENYPPQIAVGISSVVSTLFPVFYSSITMKNSTGLYQFLLHKPAHPLWNLWVRSCNDLKQVLFHIWLMGSTWHTDCLTNSGRAGWFQSTRNFLLLHLQAASQPSSWSLDFLTRIQTSVTCWPGKFGGHILSFPSGLIEASLFWLGVRGKSQACIFPLTGEQGSKPNSSLQRNLF